jgi:hypothetical protein
MAIHLDPARPDDRSAYGIVLMNVAVIGVALVSGDGLLMLMWPYWIQSVVIGYYNARRIQKLRVFSTEGFTINDEAVDPTPETRNKTWVFFAFHYGFFHFVYFIFLSAFSAQAAGTGTVPVTIENTGEVVAFEVGQLPAWGGLWLLVTLVGFVISHGQSHREHVASDLRHTRNIGTLMFIPYLRIIPMHLTIILGALLGNGGGLLLFGALKTVADVAMHKVEHRMLQGVAGARA